jgi:hypothetical protein
LAGILFFYRFNLKNVILLINILSSFHFGMNTKSEIISKFFSEISLAYYFLFKIIFLYLQTKRSVYEYYERTYCTDCLQTVSSEKLQRSDHEGDCDRNWFIQRRFLSLL